MTYALNLSAAIMTDQGNHTSHFPADESQYCHPAVSTHWCSTNTDGSAETRIPGQIHITRSPYRVRVIRLLGDSKHSNKGM